MKKSLLFLMLITALNSINGQSPYSRANSLSFYLGGGYSWHLYNDEFELPPDYVKNLKNGYHFEGQVSYYFNDVFALSFTAKKFRTTASSDSLLLLVQPANTVVAGIFKDDISVSEFYVSILRGIQFNPLYMTIQAGIGGVSYENKLAFVTQEATVTATAPGFRFAVGLDVPYTPDLIFYAKTEFVTALFNYDIDYVLPRSFPLIALKQRFNRWEFTIGLQYNLKFGDRKIKPPKQPKKKDKRQPNSRFE